MFHSFGAFVTPPAAVAQVGDAGGASNNEYVLFAAGQSNAFAVGTISQTAGAEYVDDPNVRIWNGSGWINYVAGASSGGLSNGGVGSNPWAAEAEFVRLWRLANPSARVSIVKYSIGGTALAASSGLDWSESSTSEHYSFFKAHIVAAVAAIATEGRTVVPLAFLWTQGETDGESSTNAAAYGTNLSNFIARSRTDFLGAVAPFIYARLRTGITGIDYIAAVQDGQRSVALADTRNRIVNCDFVTNSTSLHPPPAGIKQMGAAYYSAFDNSLAPSIVSNPTATVPENSTLAFTLTAIEPVNWTIVGGADQAKFELFGSTLRWASNATKDYEAPDDANHDNFYIVQVRATNTFGAQTTQTITVGVANVSEGTGYSNEADALFQREAAVGTERSSGEKTAVDTLIVSLKAAGVWAKLECLFVPKLAPTSGAALLDWARDRTAVLNGAVTWDKTTGWTSPGAGTAYIQTGVDPSAPNVAGIAFSNQWFGMQLASHGTGTSGYLMSGSKMQLSFTAASVATVAIGSLNPQASVDFGATAGRYYVSRPTSDLNAIFCAANGGARTRLSNNNTTLTSATISLFRTSSSFSGSGTSEFFAYGAALTLTEEQAFDAAISAFTSVADTIPDAFTFTDVASGATPSTFYESNIITVAGITAAASISITGGFYRINGGTYTSASGTVVNGDTVQVRLTSSSAGSTQVDATLTIGGVSDTYSVTTAAGADTTPDAFTFTDVTGATVSTLYESNIITVAGINSAAAISVAGGEYRINGGTYVSTSGTVTNGNTVQVRVTSSGSGSTTSNVTLTIGGVSDTYSVTTAGAGYGTEASALFAREEAVGTARSGADKTAADNFIAALKTAGVWTKLECLYVPRRAPTSAAAVMDWVRTRTATVNGSVTWSTAGWASTGNGTWYVSTNADPTAPNVSGLTTNNQWWGLGVATHGTGNSGGYVLGGPGNTQLAWTATSTANVGIGSLNAAAAVALGVTAGRIYASRVSTSANTLSWAVNGGARTNISNTVASTVTSGNLSLFRVSSSFFGSGLSEFFAYGSNMTLAQEQAFDAAVAAYFAA